MSDLIEDTVAVAEADHFRVWCDWAKESQNRTTFNGKPNGDNTLDWESTGRSWNIKVDTFHKMPVCIDLSFHKLGVEGKEPKIVAFWEASSVLVHYDLISKWLHTKFKHVSERSNELNFGNIVHFLEKLD